MPKAKVLNLEPKNYSAEARKVLEAFAEVVDFAGGELKLQGFDALITRLAYRVDSSLLSSADRLKAVVTATTGLNHVDAAFLQDRGIRLLSLQGETEFLRGVTATAELTWGLLLSLTREIPAFAASTRGGAWNREEFPAVDLSGRTLGILGLGRIGTVVAEYARAFRMHVIAHDPAVSEAPAGVRLTGMEEVLKNADIFSVHVSYSAKNEGLIGAAEFAKMKTGALFINTSRGELVDEAALVAALASGKVAKAALDVLAGESSGDKMWMKKSPAWAFAQKDSRLLLTPHIGGATRDSMRKTEVFMAEKLRDFWALEAGR